MLADSTVQAGYVLLDLKFICKRQIQTVCLPEKRFSGQGTAQVGQPRSLLNHQLTCISKCLDVLLLCSFYRNKVNPRGETQSRKLPARHWHHSSGCGRKLSRVVQG